MIEVITTAESMSQAKSLLTAGVDTLQIGEEIFGLRLANSFSREEMRELVATAHKNGQKINIAVNGIMHPAKMKLLPEYLAFIEDVQPDRLVVGDPGVVYALQQNHITVPFIFDAATLVTNARQINFWAKRGAVGAVLAREVPFGEMEKLATHVEVPVEVLVYGATCIHHSKRPLLQNYYNFAGLDEQRDREADFFISEPKHEETHYSIFEDGHGTHVFANNDVDLANELAELVAHQYTTWKLDGILTPGENFVAIAKLFVAAKKQIAAGTWNADQARLMDVTLHELHPENRGLDTGFYYIDPASIK